MDIDSAEATRIQPSREQLQPRFLTEFNVDESDLTENEQETRVAPNQATEMLPIIQVCKKLFIDSCLCIKRLCYYYQFFPTLEIFIYRRKMKMSGYGGQRDKTVKRQGWWFNMSMMTRFLPFNY